jgi:hypothetical protein
MRLRKPSIWFRATVDQQSRVAVTPEEPEIGNPHAIRRVRVVVPGSPNVFVCVDPAPADINTNRGPYIWPMATENYPTEILLRPEQSLALVAEIGLAQVSIIIEYLDCENGHG